MENFVVKLAAFRGTCVSLSNVPYCRILKRGYADVAYNTEPVRKIHPYKKIHPWKSLTDFSEDLVKNVIYNQNDIVVLNKPYGIPNALPTLTGADTRYKINHRIPNAAEYTLSDALPHVCQQLNYPNLIIVSKPEKYMSGITILATNEKAQKAVEHAQKVAQSQSKFVKTYWIVTTMIPNELKGKKNLAMRLEQDKHRSNVKKAVILTSWSKNDLERRRVKSLRTEFQVLANSTLNLSSLVEIKSTTEKWHAIRLFAATILYSPVLGDNLYGSRIQKVSDAWLMVNPFLPITDTLPPLKRELLELLKLTAAKQELIPAHIHLKSMCLPSLFKQGKDFVIDAPLLPPFDWTCEQLKFKHLPT